MINPFFAMAKGGFEEYNDIVDEERELANAERLAQATDTSKEVLSSSYFRTMGANGATNWFQFSDAKDETARREQDLYSLAETATPQVMENLTDEEFNNWESKAVSMMQGYHDSLIVYDQQGQVATTPNKHRFPELSNNNYTRGLWDSILSGKYVFDKTAPNAKISVSVKDNGDIQSKAINVDYGLYGMTEKEWDNKARDYAQIRGDDPRTAPANYAANYKHQIFMHSSVNPLNQTETMHEVFKRVVIGTAVNPNDITAIEEFRAGVNQNQALQLGNYEIFKALEFVAPTSHESEVPRTGQIQTMHQPKTYMDKILGIEPEQLRQKRDAARQGQRIANKILGEIEGYEAVYGTAAPATSFTSNVANFFVAFTGRQGTTLQQLSFLGSSVFEKYGVEDDGAAGYVSEQYDKYDEAIKKANKLGTPQAIAAAKTGAVAQLYSVMLAYQLAVAIQGGTGGRTVSDQDVLNMQKAFGDRMFVNQQVQKHVIKEVDLFLQDIIHATGYFTDSLNSSDLRGVMAANAHHKLFFGGLAGDEISTDLMSEKLSGRLDGAKILKRSDIKYTPEGNMVYNIGGKDGITVSDHSTYLDIYKDLKNDSGINNLEEGELKKYGLEDLFTENIETEEDAKFYLETIGSATTIGDK
jgi:hypothetical protein